MSTVHRTAAWTKASQAARSIIKAQGGGPCVDCGGWVDAAEAFDVGHIIPDSQGGSIALSNLGPSHVRCNRRAGGRMGAAKTNAKRKASRARDERLPNW